MLHGVCTTKLWQSWDEYLKHKMETQQLIILLHHLWAQTPLGKMMEILIKQYQVWAGIQNSVVVDMTACPWVPDCWLSWIWSTMCTYNTLIQHKAWSVPPLHQNDVYIMEAAQELVLTNSQLKQINACRMHLQITTLVDMTTTPACHFPPSADKQPTYGTRRATDNQHIPINVA